MSTITLPNRRVGSDLTVRLKLKDGGLAIDWSTLSRIKAFLYSDAQRALAGRCDVSVDGDDPTILVCRYASTKMQYLGVNRIIVQCSYMGETKTYDKPALNFVRWTEDQEGEELTIDDPEVDVEIDVEDVTSSILQNILDACIKATEEAQEVVDVGRGPRGYSAYQVAVQDGFEGTEDEWLESLVGPAGESAYQLAVDQGYEGTLPEWLASLHGADGDSAYQIAVEEGFVGTKAQWLASLVGPQGLSAYQVAVVNGYQGTVSEWLASLVGPVGPTPAFSIGTVQTGAAGSQASASISGTAAAPVLNLVIPKGDQGNTGSSVDYPYELVNNRTTDDATKGLSAAEGKRLGDDLSQLEAEVHHLSGKYYGVFEMPSELPEGDVAGYAFVGETMPLSLYNFDGEDWSDTGIAVSGITGPQGPQGIQGIQGIQGLPGVTSAVLTIDNETGIPYGEISVLNGVLSIALHNIKGLQGNSGYSGAAGELQIVNNTYQGGATSALSAEMGKHLEENKVSGRVENQQDNDFAIADENDYDIVQFKNGDVKTKNFDSAKAPYSETTEDGADFEVNDANGFAILRCIGGHIKTKNFDSSTVGASPLAGKKVAFIGDSIIAGYNASPTTKRFSTVFCELAGCTEKNLGVASTAIANNTLNGLGSSRFITRATSANLSGQDLIFVFGGTNDFSYDSKPIGEPFNIATITPDTYIGDKKKTAPSDTDTFSGALHELILQIRSVAPSAQLVFITPLTRGRYNSGRPTSAECNQHGDFLQDFTDTIKTVCSFYSVPVVDMGVMMNQFWANDGNGTFGSYDSDGIHPNNAGHERIAKLLYKWVNNNLIF